MSILDFARDRRVDLEKTRAKSERWHRLAEEEGVFAAFDEIEAALKEAIANTAPRDTEGRECVYRQILGLRSMRQAFDIVIGGGKAAARQLEDLSNQR